MIKANQDISLPRVSQGFWVWAGFRADHQKLLDNARLIVQKHLNGPDFPCHLTLLGPLEHTQRVILTKLQQPLPKSASNNCHVKVLGIKHAAKTYESLFAAVTISPELENLRTHLLSEFAMEGNNWDPHISLHYGDNDQREKEEAIRQISESLPTTLDVSYLWLAWVDEHQETWKVISSIPLIKP